MASLSAKRPKQVDGCKLTPAIYLLIPRIAISFFRVADNSFSQYSVPLPAEKESLTSNLRPEREATKADRVSRFLLDS